MDLLKELFPKNWEKAFTFLYCIVNNLEYQISDEMFISLIKNKIIEKDILTGNLIILIDIFNQTNDNVSTLNILTDIETHIQEYRKLFSSIRTLAIGDKNTVKNNLLNFIKKNNVTMLQIIEATRDYIQNNEPKYIPNADNFIYSIRNGKEISYLEIALESYNFKPSSDVSVI